MILAIEPTADHGSCRIGFMELGETVAQARETMEEARACVELDDLFSLLSVPHVHPVRL